MAVEGPLILVVEDDTDTRTSLKTTLEDDGYQVETAVDGLDAIQKLRGGLRPRLILLDINMPKVSGMEFLAIRKNEPAWAEIPVIILTAAGSRGVPSVVNVVAVLFKPVLLPVLLEAVDRLCRR